MGELNASNQFLVGMAYDEITIGLRPFGPISRDQALNLAAWLVALADRSEGHEHFERILAKVEGA